MTTIQYHAAPAAIVPTTPSLPPNRVPKPAFGWFLYAGDGQRACRIKDDMHAASKGYQSRTLSEKITLGITGMTNPWWSWIDGKVHEYKTTTRLDRNRAWCNCWEYFLGRRNWVSICQPGHGEMDFNEKDTNPDTDPLKLQSIDYANNLRSVLPLSGLAPRWTHVDVLQFSNPLVFEDGVWKVFHRGQWIELSWEGTPQYFLSRTLCGHTADKPPVSYGPVVDKGYPGGAGDVKHPTVMSHPAILPTEDLAFYDLPFKTRIYRDSLLVEGIPVTRTGGMEVTIDALCFVGGDTYGRAVSYPNVFHALLAKVPHFRRFAQTSYDWYLLDQMLVRGSIEDKSAYGTWRDRRVFSDWLMKNMVCSTPTIGWIRSIYEQHTCEPTV